MYKWSPTFSLQAHLFLFSPVIVIVIALAMKWYTNLVQLLLTYVMLLIY